MRHVKRFFAVVVVLLVTTIVIVFALLRASLPDYDATIAVGGVSDTVFITRDTHGVPHINGATEQDIAFGLGFAHAQDRLFQMDINRRIGAGRMAEILGAQGFGFDRYFRTLNFAGKAKSAFKNLDDTTRNALQSYADGVNAFLAQNMAPLPPEFLILGYEPEVWKPTDTLIWQKMMWLDLSGNARHEVARAQLLAKLSPEQVESLYPTYPGDTEFPLPKLADLYENLPLEALAARMGPPKPPGYGSNNWVISGAHTASGMPLLANDPHLGLTTPSIWYLARLHNRSDASNVVGVSFPGSPAIILGRNDKIAWGFTNTNPDIQDLYVEKLVGENQYLTPNGPADFITRTEIIRIKGEHDRLITVRETRHGPVISDVQDNLKETLGDAYVIAMQWTALGEKDMAPKALRDLNKASDFGSFVAAISAYFGPEQNMVYADTDGNIGYFAPAMVPVRHPDNAIGGRIPSPGWDDIYDWQGFLPLSALPQRYNPKGGIIATANEKIVDQDYPHYLTRDWALPYRGNRIRHELEARQDHSVESFQKLQGDIVSDMARDVLPWMLDALDKESDARSLLTAWDGIMDKDRPEPLLFQTWLRTYYEALVADELGDLFKGQRRVRPRLIKSGLYWEAGAEQRATDKAYYALSPLESTIARAWCDNVATEAKETCRGLAADSFDAAVEKLSGTYGPKLSAWRWGDAHILTQSHRPFGVVPVLGDFFQLSGEQSGGRYTVNVAGNNVSPSGAHRSSFGPSYRGIFDLSDMNNSRFVQPTGQSGHPLSPFHGNMFGLWSKTESFKISTETAEPAEAIGTVKLYPQ